jgi:hypothetical protein
LPQTRSATGSATSDFKNAAIFDVNSLGDGTSLHAETFSIGASFLHIEVAHVSTEFTMNIFYIIGVVVVILFVAGFFGLHA